MKNCLENVSPVPTKYTEGRILGGYTVLGITVAGTTLPGFPPLIFFNMLYAIQEVVR
jgi:hypothetical protein